MEDIILEFWKCSLKSDFSEFDWDEAFGEYEPFLEQNCTDHGHCDFETFKERMEEYYGDLTADLPSWSLYQNDTWGWQDPEDVVDAMLKVKQEFLQSNFSADHADNYDLLLKLRDRRGMTEPELIQLFDECIHAQHYNGDILDDVDVEYLRELAEAEYKDEQERFPTEIRAFL
jgi:hypothetical protein